MRPPAHLAIPTFIHLDTDDHPPRSRQPKQLKPSSSSSSSSTSLLSGHHLHSNLLRTHGPPSHSPSRALVHGRSKQVLMNKVGPTVAGANDALSAVDQATLFMKRFSISRDHHLHPHAKRRRGGGVDRPYSSRVRAKRGLSSSASSSSTNLHQNGDDDGSSTGNSNLYLDSRSLNLQSYMQSRRLRLHQRQMRQRQGRHQRRQHNTRARMLPEGSDVSIDEDGDEDGHDVYDADEESFPPVATLDPEQYRQSIWALEQRLWERTQSATRSRSHLLMKRRLSAGERVDHAQRVAQRQRADQERRQRQAQEELDQKMMRAMARRNAYLEAAIENDPSRRFRRRSSVAQAEAVSVAASSSSATLGTGVESTLPLGSRAGAVTSTRLIQKSAGSSVTAPHVSQTVKKTKAAINRAVDMTPSMTTTRTTATLLGGKERMMMMTSHSEEGKKGKKEGHSTMDERGSISGASKSSEMNKVNKDGVWAQRTGVDQGLIQSAAKDYLTALGGSHEQVLAMGFDDLARLLHANKNLVQATLRLLQYAFEQGRALEDGSLQQKRRVFKAPARVFLSMYMILAHPDQIRSPSEANGPQATADTDDSSFQSLIESSKHLLTALQAWLTETLKEDNPSSHTTASPSEPSLTAPTFTEETRVRLAYTFDQAWHGYYDLFEAWKAKDADKLLNTLLQHACHIESLWQTVRTDPSARHEWEPRIEEQRIDLREKAGKLAGSSGIAKLDAVFADFVAVVAPRSTSSTASSLVDNSGTQASETAPSSASTSSLKRQRADPAVPCPEATTTSTDHEMEDVKGSTQALTSSATTTQSDSLDQSDYATAISEPQPKKAASEKSKLGQSAASSSSSSSSSSGLLPTATATTPAPTAPTRASGSRQKPIKELSALPAGFEKPSQWTNLQLIHELALDPNFKIESKRGVAAAAAAEAGEGAELNPLQNLEARVRAMATKAYFDAIREDAEKGQLGKWIPALLTTIRDQLLDMVPVESAMAMQVSEAFELEFVQQQVERNVFDVKKAIETVLEMMSKLCAPVRDPAIRQIQQDLERVTMASEGDAGVSGAKDLVEVLKDILELLEEMLMDLANFRLMVARPRLEKQAIPYEQNAFKQSLADNSVSLQKTTAWLRQAAAHVLSTSPEPSATATPTTAASSSSSTSAPSASTTTGMKSNRHYEIFIQAVLDLLFAKTPLESLESLPETFALDRARLERYQNELQAIALVAVLMNLAQSVPPTLKDSEPAQLKAILLKLLESPDSGHEVLAEAILDFKEKCLAQSQARARSRSPVLTGSLSSSPSSSSSSSSSTSTISPDQKIFLRNTIANALSFKSNLYTVLSQRLRAVLSSYLLCPGATANLPDPATMTRNGLFTLTDEIEKLAALIRFMTKYNAQVYRAWYDPILTSMIHGTPLPKSLAPLTVPQPIAPDDLD